MKSKNKFWLWCIFGHSNPVAYFDKFEKKCACKVRNWHMACVIFLVKIKLKLKIKKKNLTGISNFIYHNKTTQIYKLWHLYPWVPSIDVQITKSQVSGNIPGIYACQARFVKKWRELQFSVIANIHLLIVINIQSAMLQNFCRKIYWKYFGIVAHKVKQAFSIPTY